MNLENKFYLIDSFFFWLPFYLRDRFTWKESDSNLLSTLYDVGGIIGGIVGGLFSVSYIYN
jgi:OPA family glycerol-3-phosphate transporter-like MFS transporter 3